MRYVSFSVSAYQCNSAKPNYNYYYVQPPTCQNTNFTAFNPPSLLQGIQETTWDIEHTISFPSIHLRNYGETNTLQQQQKQKKKKNQILVIMTMNSKLTHKSEVITKNKMCGMCRSALFSLIQTSTNIKKPFKSIQTAQSVVSLLNVHWNV